MLLFCVNMSKGVSCMYVCMYVCMCVCVCMYACIMYVCMHVCMCVCIYIYVYIYICVCVCVCMYVCIYLYWAFVYMPLNNDVMDIPVRKLMALFVTASTAPLEAVLPPPSSGCQELFCEGVKRLYPEALQSFPFCS